MSEVVKELPFDTGEIYKNTQLQPSYSDREFMPEIMYKNISPFEIKTSVHHCFACDVKKYTKPLELANFDASVMVIGQTPGDVDARTSEGKQLMDVLSWAGYALQDVYVTSLVKCEESQQPERCHHHVLSELLCVQPKMVISLGYEVGKYFDTSINSAGYTSQLLSKYEMITTYRTSYAMTDQQAFQSFCNHILQARHRVVSILQGS